MPRQEQIIALAESVGKLLDETPSEDTSIAVVVISGDKAHLKWLGDHAKLLPALQALHHTIGRQCSRCDYKDLEATEEPCSACHNGPERPYFKVPWEVTR